METTFYHDESHTNKESIKRLKTSMTLDFTHGDSSSKSAKHNNLFQTPDVNVLKFASPELERMIFQANGIVTTSSTPTQLLCSTLVTEEQEAYARGFVDALAELHKGYSEEKPSSPPPGFSLARPHDFSYTQTFSEGTTTQGQHELDNVSLADNTIVIVRGYKTTHSSVMPAHQSDSTTVIPMSTHSTVSSNEESRIVKLKEEPQTVNCLGSTPSLSPISMESQDIIKLERKRSRNRVAARKCRTRKLERISAFEERIKGLQDKNLELSQVSTTLRDEIFNLKQQLIAHVNSGCRILDTHSFR